MGDRTGALRRLIEAELDLETPPAFRALAEAVHERHAAAAIGVLFYGSCLRTGEDRDQVADFYLIVARYGPTYGNPLMAFANRLLPPNVFYIEVPFEDRRVRAKYAIVSLGHLEALVAPQTLQPYFWARFSQPMRLLWVCDETGRQRLVEALSRAVATTAESVRALDGRPEAVFERAFRESYATELRPESGERAAALYRFDQDRYRRIAAILFPAEETEPRRDGRAAKRARARWRRRRLVGKALSVLRLTKAAFTFKDGASYLLWKIERHSGVRHELTPWQQRHPILASSVVFWQLYRKGAFR